MKKKKLNWIAIVLLSIYGAGLMIAYLLELYQFIGGIIYAWLGLIIIARCLTPSNVQKSNKITKGGKD